MLIQNPDGIMRLITTVIRAVARRLPSGPLVGRFRRDASGELRQSGALERCPPRTLKVDEVTVRFGGVVALSDVRLAVGPGEVVSLIGPNGAGKTTLIDAVTGFTRPAHGAVHLDGTDLGSLSAYRRSRQGVARTFQNLELFEDMTVADNLRAACDPHDSIAYLLDLVRPRPTPLPLAAWRAIDEFGLAEDLERRPSELSFGKRRLVGIARAVASRPSILLLDEPAAGLDERETAELGDVVRRLAKEWGIGVLLVEHDMSLVMEIADRVVVLNFGRNISEGTPEAVRRDEHVIAAYLGSSPDGQAELASSPPAGASGSAATVEGR
jgi:sulfate-transporting ATPase